MLLLSEPIKRTRSHNLALGGTTAITAGMVNVSSVMAFFAFSSNVTGHVAVFAEEIAKGHWHQVSVVFGWLLAFLGGAVVANTLVCGLGARGRIGYRAAAPVLQVLILVVVGYYCQFHYAETLRETEYLVACLLFSMGLQNSMVSSVSGGVVKTTHVTGLFTELGIVVAMLLRGEHLRDMSVVFRFLLHLTILGGYLLGGIAGGLVYMQFQYASLFLGAGVLASVLMHDLVVLWRSAPDRAAAASSRQTYPPSAAE